MNASNQSNNNLIVDLWTSYREQPLWVQIWVGLILMPVNMVSLAFISEPMGLWVAGLANIALLLNLPILLYERGFSRTMALPHLIPWTLLVGLLLFARPDATGLYAGYLWVLLVINMISLLFDYPESYQWLQARKSN